MIEFVPYHIQAGMKLSSKSSCRKLEKWTDGEVSLARNRTSYFGRACRDWLSEAAPSVVPFRSCPTAASSALGHVRLIVPSRQARSFYPFAF